MSSDQSAWTDLADAELVLQRAAARLRSERTVPPPVLTPQQVAELWRRLGLPMGGWS